MVCTEREIPDSLSVHVKMDSLSPYRCREDEGKGGSLILIEVPTVKITLTLAGFRVSVCVGVCSLKVYLTPLKEKFFSRKWGTNILDFLENLQKKPLKEMSKGHGR